MTTACDLTDYAARSGALLAWLQWAGTVIETAICDIDKGELLQARNNLSIELQIIKTKLCEVDVADAMINAEIAILRAKMKRPQLIVSNPPKEGA